MISDDFIEVYPNAMVEIKNVYTYLSEDYGESQDHIFQLDHLIRMSRLNNKVNRSVLYFSDNSYLILGLCPDEHESLAGCWMNRNRIANCQNLHEQKEEEEYVTVNY